MTSPEPRPALKSTTERAEQRNSAEPGYGSASGSAPKVAARKGVPSALGNEPQGTDGAALLEEVEAFHRRFNAFPTEAAYVAVALWNARTHLLDCFDSTPRLAFLSPEPGSGKTRGLEICGTLVPHPMAAVNASPAALFRAVSINSGRPTILFEEIDTVFGPKAGDNEELRGLINAGHRRIGVSYRCVAVGDQQTVQPFPVYAAVAVAGLGWLRTRSCTAPSSSACVAGRRTSTWKPSVPASTNRKGTRCGTASPHRRIRSATAWPAPSPRCRKASTTGRLTCGSRCWLSRTPQAGLAGTGP